MEYLIYGLIGGLMGSFFLLKILSSSEKKHTKIPTRIKKTKWEKKVPKELDEMLNKFKND